MKPSNWHPEDVKCAVRKTGISLAKLAQAAGLSAVSGRNCLYFPVPSANRAIADHLDIPVQKIWPEWFGPDGERIVRIRPDSSAAGEAPQRKTGQAA